MTIVPVRVLSLLSLFILILHACSLQGEYVEAAKSNYKEFTVKESGVVGRKMMINCFKQGSLRFERASMKTRKLQERNTLHVKEEQENVGNSVPEEKDLSGYVAFNADYKGPRHHPPKNN